MSYAADGFQVWQQAIPVELVEQVRQTAYQLFLGCRGRFAPPYGAYRNADGTYWHTRHVLPRFDDARELLKWLPLHGMFAPGMKLAITHSKFSYKLVGEDWTWQPHQDIAYKPEPRSGVTYAIPLEKVDRSNGTLQVGPRLGHVAEHLAVGEQLQMEICPWELKDLEMAQGDIASFSLYSVHRSLPNKSHGLRAMLFIEVEPLKDSLTDDLGGAPIVL